MLRRLAPFAADLWQHRELLWQFTLRNVELRHKGSHLGLIWSVLNPLLTLALYVLVFGYIFGGSYGVIAHETRFDYALGMLVGLMLFGFVAEAMGSSLIVIVGNPNFVKRVVFPLQILPIALVGSALIHLLISLTLVLLGIMCLGSGLSSGALWLPVILLPVILLAMGVAWLFAGLGVFFRDLGQIMQFLTNVLMFSSAVFYSAEKIPAAAWTVMRFNPVLLAIELGRDALLWSRPLNFHHLGYLYFAGFASCYLGHAAFRRMRPAFADVL
ncbi:MAG: ABC transporter permease [Lacunisphaera sp.]